MPRDLIRHIRFAEGRRIICISDIHGHLTHLDRLLEKICFCSDDFLIIIGDAIEDGYASLGSLRRVMELEKAGNALMLSGNWDYFMHMLMLSDDANDQQTLLTIALTRSQYLGSSLLLDMCRELDIPLTRESDMQKLMPVIRDRFSEELSFMGNMPIILDAGDFVCVHGGIHTMDEAELAKCEPHTFLKNDAFAEQGLNFDRWLITGHWPVANYDNSIACYAPHIYPDRRIVAIDGGCGKQEAAQLNALIMQAGKPGEFDFAFFDDFPRVTALDNQTASNDPIHTNWNTRFIDVISKSDEFAKIRHHATGKLLEVPLRRLWMQNGTEVLGDYTDYELPVEPGDVLSVLFETSKGLCCKKGSVSGWYRGRYAKIEN